MRNEPQHGAERRCWDSLSFIPAYGLAQQPHRRIAASTPPQHAIASETTWARKTLTKHSGSRMSVGDQGQFSGSLSSPVSVVAAEMVSAQISTQQSASRSMTLETRRPFKAQRNGVALGANGALPTVTASFGLVLPLQ